MKLGNVRATASIVIALGALALSPAALAQARGAYVGGSLGQSTVSDGCGVVAAGVACDETSTAWKAVAGYQIGRNFAVEAGYSRLSDRDSGSAGGASRTKSNALEAVVIGGNPLTANFGIYGKFGLYNARTKMTSAAGSASESASNLTFGLGARYDISKPVALRAEWQRYKHVGGDSIGTSDITVLSLGAIYKF